MATVVFLDTSILCEVLQVPGKNQCPEVVADEMRQRLDRQQSLVLPTATIIETGNHIAQLTNGNERRSNAEKLATVLRSTAAGTAPWIFHSTAWDPDLLAAMCDGVTGCPSLAEMASREVGLGDVSILAEARGYRAAVARVTVEIWTLDNGLRAYA